MPVSYTHLSGYRLPHTKGIFLVNHRRDITVLVQQIRRIQHPVPVSYTHLDVYKRQPQGSREPRQVLTSIVQIVTEFQSTRLSRASTTPLGAWGVSSGDFNPQGSREPRLFASFVG